MRLLKSYLMCSFAVALVCPEGYVPKDGKCYKKPQPPTIITFKVIKKEEGK